MNDLMNPFGQNQGPQSFDKIRISIAAPERIRSWSFGEIKKPENPPGTHPDAKASNRRPPTRRHPLGISADATSRTTLRSIHSA